MVDRAGGISAALIRNSSQNKINKILDVCDYGSYSLAHNKRRHLSDHDTGFHTQNLWAHKRVQRLHCRERRQPWRSARPHSCADRPQWGGQDHLLQSLDQVPVTHPRKHSFQQCRDHSGSARPDCSQWSCSLVSDIRSIPSPHGDRERAHRPSAKARRLISLLALPWHPEYAERPCDGTVGSRGLGRLC